MCMAQGESSVMAEIITGGPVLGLVSVDEGFVAYNGGVFKHENTLSRYTGLTNQQQPVLHAVKVIGWGSEGRRLPYWIIENSWGDQWGEGGYARIYRGTKGMRPPGSTIRFFCVFFVKIIIILIKVWGSCLGNGRLAQSARSAIRWWQIDAPKRQIPGYVDSNERRLILMDNDESMKLFQRWPKKHRLRLSGRIMQEMEKALLLKDREEQAAIAEVTAECQRLLDHFM